MVFRIDIMDNIDEIVSGDYTRWTIGITEDPDRRKEEHKNPAMWFQWQAGSHSSLYNFDLSYDIS